ncbi:hypothetical protein [Gilvimarinus xylanilyticus]|uniref:Uncharacterized protein n=1 Tax=Gilvimarinus xylanilyticus TaxID=2944139 RepID=A0A9X2KT47_9GAMM|nr:hypothetical protein [Gilvimarinus xylanilyticus]MCP8898812.1 hypothetical protein [Gilvimarinus xylanilyticus]
MSASLYEIVELANGEVVLQRADEEGEPLLSIKFSTESQSFMREGKFDIAKAMIEAGMEAAGDLADAEPEDFAADSDDALYADRTLH